MNDKTDPQVIPLLVGTYRTERFNELLGGTADAIYHMNFMVTARVRAKLFVSTLDQREATVQRCWEYLLNYYKQVSPKMYGLLTSPDYRGTPHSHVTSVFEDGVEVWIPAGWQPSTELLNKLMAHYLHMGNTLDLLPD